MFCKAMLHGLISLAILGASPAIAGDTWGFAAEQMELREHAIVEVGDIRKLNPMEMDSSKAFYSLGSNCFQIIGLYGYWGYGGKAGMLVVGKDKLPKVAIFENGIGSIEVKVKPVILYKCPTP